MKVHFKHPRVINGERFEEGHHVLSDKHKGWFLDALVKQGDVVLADVEKKEKPVAAPTPEVATPASFFKKSKKD
jgi:hypothetical protein